jgi:hypothetical protein
VDPEHWLGGGAEGRINIYSDVVYFRHNLGCRTAPNASELVTDVWKLSRSSTYIYTYDSESRGF